VAYAIGRGGSKVTCVEATWKQPKVTCTKKEQRFSISVGIDGWTSSEMHVKAPKTVEVGTESECVSGVLTTSGWHVASPSKFFQYFYFHPAVGDVVWAQVRVVGGQFMMALRDKTTGVQVETTEIVPKISRVTARWQVSSVSIDCDTKCKLTPLAKFSPIVFSGAQATVNGKRVAIGGAPIVDVIDFAAAGTVKRLVTSKLSAGGRSFTVTWKHT
jgi:Peptidase A4 family